jgi:Mn2+/Fe2+ NRAMP family transporter
MPRHTFYLLFVLLCIATGAHAASASGTAEQEAGSNSTAAQAPTAHHKTLTPLIGTDIGLFIVVAVALFIASGAGVGGGKTHAAVELTQHLMTSLQRALEPFCSRAVAAAKGICFGLQRLDAMLHIPYSLNMPLSLLPLDVLRNCACAHLLTFSTQLHQWSHPRCLAYCHQHSLILP